MSHARLTHDSRPTLEFRQGQRDEDSRSAVANIASPPGFDAPPFVHITTRERSRKIIGRVTAPRRARNDGSTSDWQQALANYVDELESHCNEFQGTGYTFVDDVRSESINVAYPSLEWVLQPGTPYEIEFTVELVVGEPYLEAKALNKRTPTVDTGMSVVAKVDGNDLPGLRDMRSKVSFEYDTAAIYDKSSAENNGIIATSGTKQQFSIEGTHTGTDAQRAAADSALDALIGTQVTLETRFPGYDLTGYVTSYDSNLEASFGTGRTDYSLEFVEGRES